MKVSDDDIGSTTLEDADIIVKTGSEKHCYIEDHNHSSSDEAEFSSSSSTSEKDYHVGTIKPGATGRYDIIKENNNVLTENVSDFGYESSTSSSDNGNEDIPKDVPRNLRVLIDGLNRGLPMLPQDNRPKWLDMEKYRKGQEFAAKYYFGVNFAEMLSLLMLFTFNDSFKPLQFTDQSSTPFSSFKRYLSTVLRVKSWFENDVFEKGNPGYNNIKVVRSLHNAVYKRMNSVPVEEVDNRIAELTGSRNLVSNSVEIIKDDFRASMCPFASNYGYPKRSNPIFFNQCSMSITQFGFIGLIILHPEKFGASAATKEELEGFIHLWKVIGYLLGIEDRYNFCNGDLDEVRARCNDLLNFWVVPNFTGLSLEWEHFSRCLVKGVSFYVPGNTFEVSILYLCFVLNINAKRFYTETSWSMYFRYLFFKFTLCTAIKWPWLLNMANRSLRASLSRAKNFSSERISRLEEMSRMYMNM